MGIPAEWQNGMHCSPPMEQCREYWLPVLPEQFSFCHLFSIKKNHLRKWYLHASQHREIKGMCSKVIPVLNQGLSIHVLHSYSSVSTVGNTTQSVCHTAPTYLWQPTNPHKYKPGSFSEAPLCSLISVTFQHSNLYIFTHQGSFQEHTWKASRSSGFLIPLHRGAYKDLRCIGINQVSW